VTEVTDPFLEPWRYPALFHADEDISSLVVRMAAYGSMSQHDFVRKYLKGGISEGHGLIENARTLGRLAIISGVDEAALRLNAFLKSDRRPSTRNGPLSTFRNADLPRDVIGLRKRVAPGLLNAGEPYIRLAWRFSVLPCDPYSGEVLISRCAECSMELLWSAKQVCACSYCDADLRKVRSVYLASNEVRSVQTIAHAMGLMEHEQPSTIDLPAPFDDLDLLGQLHALAWLAGIRGQLDGTQITNTVANAYLGLPLAQEWQKTVEQTVSLFLRHTAGETDSVIGAMLNFFGQAPFGIKTTIINHLVDCASQLRSTHKPSEDQRFYDMIPYLDLPLFADVRSRLYLKAAIQLRTNAKPLSSTRNNLDGAGS
jgi:hypothetical protein